MSNQYNPEVPPPNPSGLCFCGCGQQAPIAFQSDFRKGILKGHPMRFVHNHHMRKFERYQVEDRGYKTPCWIWQLSLNEDGYGQWSRQTGTTVAHRAYYEIHVGPIPEGLLLDHLCRVRCCVNPDHMDPVTSVVNTRRGLNAKISAEDVPVVRKLRDEGLTYREIGERFGVTAPAIYLIIKGDNWKGI